MKVLRFRLAAVLFSLCLLASSGCVTTNRAHPSAPVAPAATPAPPAAPAPVQAAPSPAPAAPAPTLSPAAPTPVAPPTAVAGGLLNLLVDSTPPGAVIVLDGVPVGKAPMHLKLAATPLGFFQNYVEIRARFVATDEAEITRSAVEEFTPREKVPAALHFTPSGAERTMR